MLSRPPEAVVTEGGFMKSIRSLYKTGLGPSSSHTFGPRYAAELFTARFPNAEKYRVTLYGSLAVTGIGHGTDRAILSVIPEAEIICDTETKELPHPNTMLFEAVTGGKTADSLRVFSIGGGEIRVEGEAEKAEEEIYPEKNLSEVIRVCEKERITLSEYVYLHEGWAFRDFLGDVWNTMKAAIERGLRTEGILPGGLNIERKAKLLHEMRCYNEDSDITQDRKVASFAYAVSEENADGGTVVTAPTCGSAGVIPAVFYFMQTERGFPEREIIDALAVSGLVGNVIRTNASISGAECGCQAEIGSACSMAAAGLAALNRLSMQQIEYAAEVAMEHHLGLTCDPVKGLVQIPCIERNAVAAMRAIHSVNLARFLYETRKISFDAVIETMYRTGTDISEKYRETSGGGLAGLYKD